MDSGWNRLAQLGNADIAEAVLGAVGSTGEDVRPYGDGQATEEIVERLTL